MTPDVGSDLFAIDFNYWFLQTVAMMITAFAVPRLKITGILGALGTVLALAFINSKIWDAALFFHIPSSLSVQALLLLVTNGVIFYVLVKLMPGIQIKGILPAICAPLVFTITSLVISNYAHLIDWKAVFDTVFAGVEKLRAYFLESDILLKKDV